VSYFKGFSDNTSPVRSCSSTRAGRSSARRAPEIGVGARVYYTRGDRDEQLPSITDSGNVRLGQGNKGD
jgi:hypothetical protein